MLQLKLPPTKEREGAFTAKLVEAIHPSGKKAMANTVPELEYVAEVLPAPMVTGAGDQTTEVGGPETPTLLKDNKVKLLVQPVEGVKIGIGLVVTQTGFEMAVEPPHEVTKA